LITIDAITPENAFVFKTVRLSALKDAPHAFRATYAKESEFADAEWLQRAEQMNGQRAAGFLAMDGDQACGIVGSFLESNDRTRVQLVSMWTAPTPRHRGIGRRLVNEVLRWAHLRGAHTLLLMVTSNNEPAIRFYELIHTNGGSSHLVLGTENRAPNGHIDAHRHRGSGEISFCRMGRPG